MLRADNDAGIRTAIGVGTTDAPTFLAQTLTGQSLTGVQATSLLDLSTTWLSTTGTPTAIKLNVTDTANAPAASKLMELQVGGVGKFRVEKHGGIKINDGTTAAGSDQRYISFNTGWGEAYFGLWGGDLYINGGALSSFSVNSPAFFTTHIGLGGNKDTANVKLWKDADNILAQRNGDAAQAFRLYNFYNTAGVNYERGEFVWSGNTLFIQAIGAGSGVAQPLSFGGASINFRTSVGAGYVARWNFSTTGHFLAATDNAYDIGASGANRPKNIYLSGFISSELGYGKSGLSGASQGLQFSGSTTNIVGGAAGASVQLVTNDGTLYISCIPGLTRFVGTTSAFPAIKRNATGIDIRLADDSGFAPLAAANLDLPASAAASAVQQLTVGRIVYAGEGYRVGNNFQVVFSNGTDYARGIGVSASGGLSITNGTTGGQSLQFVEMTAPAAPATNGVRIYAEDNGAGKTRIMALFATGVAQQIAIEP